MFRKDNSCKKEMKVGDRVRAICFPGDAKSSYEVSGKIILWDPELRTFIFEADKGQKFAIPLHTCRGLVGHKKGYYVRGYGITDDVRIIPAEKIFNGLLGM